MAHQAVQAGIPFWGRSLIDPEEAKGLRSSLERTKSFLESLQTYTSPGRLKNFRHEASAVSGHASGLELLAEVEALQGLVSEFGPTAAFLTAAEAMLPPSHEWVGQMKGARSEVLAELARSDRRDARVVPAPVATETQRTQEAFSSASISIFTPRLALA